MDTPADGWDAILDRALAAEVPGEVHADLVAHAIHRAEAAHTTSGRRARDAGGSITAWVAAWLVVAAAVVALHVRTAPGDYRDVAAVLAPVLEHARLDLIVSAIAALALVEGAARSLTAARKP